MRRKSFAQIGTSILVIFVILLGVFFINRAYKDNLLEQSNKNALESCVEYTLFIENELNFNAEFIEIVGKLIGDLFIEKYENNTDEVINRVSGIFTEINSSGSIISNIYFIKDDSGDGFNSNGIVKFKNLANDLRERQWYKDAKKRYNIIITDVYDDIRDGKKCFSLAYSVRNNNEIIGVIVADLFLDDIYDHFTEVIDIDSYDVKIVSKENKLIFCNEKELLGTSYQDYVEKHMIKEDKISFLNNKLWDDDFNRELYKIRFQGNFKDINIYGYDLNIERFEWKVISSINNKELSNKLSNNLIMSLLGGMFISIILILIINYFYKTTYYIDNLTGFNTRHKLLSILRKDPTYFEHTGVLFITLKNITWIKSKYGDETTDLIIKKYADMLKKIFSHVGEITRSKEDEFIIVFKSFAYERRLEFTQKHLNQLKLKRFNINESILELEAFIALIEFDGEETKQTTKTLPQVEEILETLELDNINSFIYQKFSVIQSERNEAIVKLNFLRDAIRQDKIIPFFQPIKNMKSNEIKKYEVLMRIKDGDKYLSPYPYIVLAEKYNLIEEIDLRMLEKALIYKKEIDKNDELTFSFNVSGKLLNNSNYLNKVINIIEQYGNKPESIIFEITETENIQDLQTLSEILIKFKQLGYQFSLDDFGTGFSSVKYLKNIPVDYIKIDGSFIKDMNLNRQNYYLVESMVNMAKAFKLKTVAEFVENEEILDSLIKLGIDFTQGYYISKPQNSVL